MGSGNGKKIIQVAAAAGGYALGGPIGGAAALAATRKLQGKELLGSDISPDMPGLPEIPAPPERDARNENALRQATIAEILRRTKRGPGRKTLVGTTPLGVTAPLRSTERRLRGA